MDFNAIKFFLFLYFIRPQDWIPGIAGAHLVAVNMVWAIAATVLRPGGSALNSLFKTPHDWVMFTYFGWVLWMAPDFNETFQDVKSLCVFYIVTLLALSSWDRMVRFLTWWTILLVMIAALAVGSLFGIDLTGAVGRTLAEQGRLCLNTWMLDNPNALGHTVIGAIPLIYFAFIWRRDSQSWLSAPIPLILAGSCVYYTQSKGAFLVGAVTAAASQIFGRPRIAQIIIICVALTVGSVAITQLPRMQTLSRSDEGIQGRLLSWQCARDSMFQHPYGVGWKNFVSHFRWQREWVELATHGSYVQVGAALGYGGLFLYLGVLYCGFRTLFQAETRTVGEERIRRMLFCLLFSYTLSNWMIDRAYHTEFFVIAAAIGAFHRLCSQTRVVSSSEEEKAAGDKQRLAENAEPYGESEWLGVEHRETETATFNPSTSSDLDAESAPTATLSSSLVVAPAQVVAPPSSASESLAYEEEQPSHLARIRWQRLGIVDLAIMGMLLWGVLSAWDYILKNF